MTAPVDARIGGVSLPCAAREAGDVIPFPTQRAVCTAPPDAPSRILPNPSTFGRTVKRNVRLRKRLQLLSAEERPGKRHLVGELEIGAHRHAPRDPCDAQVRGGLEEPREV